MGRKRNQGKARRAAKAKAREEAKKEVDNQPANSPEQQSLSAAAQIQQFQIDEEKCAHGLFDLSISTDITQFVDKFHSSFITSNKRNLEFRLQAAEDATMPEFADVLKDLDKMETAISCFLCLGTQNLLESNYDGSTTCATIARICDQYIAVDLKQTQALPNRPKLYETYYADLHTLVKFFRHRIPCSCLDKMYEEVKHITKISICGNPQCSIPRRKVDRSKTKYCSRCRNVSYCSRECQEADWSRHKATCDEFVAMKAEFDAKQKNM